MLGFRPFLKFFSFLCLSLLILSLPALATTKWVDQAGGSDANDGDSEATAYATLQFAIDNSASGIAGTPSIINVKDGTYGEDPPLLIGGFSTANLVENINYLTIQAVPGHEPKVAPVTAVAVNISSMGIETANNIVIDNIDSDQTVAWWDNFHIQNSDNLTIKNSDFQGGEDGIDWETGATDVLIENCNFGNLDEDTIDMSDGTYVGLVVQDCTFEANQRRPFLLRDTGGPLSDITIRRNVFFGTNDQEAVRMIGVDGGLFENNVVMNSHQQGLYIDAGCANITVQHNTFFNSDQEGVGNGEMRTVILTADIVIKNNIFNGNGSNPAIQTTAASLPGEDYNHVFNVVDPLTWGANTVVGVDPQFVDTTAGSEDLHLQAGSPALEAGTPLGVTDDNEKSVRPNPPLSNPDKGAYEHPAAAVPAAGSWVLAALFGLLTTALAWTMLRRRLA